MEWNKKGYLSEKVNNKGMTTIVVVCAMAIIMALSLGLFLTASVLMQGAGQTAAREQSRILAVSFSKQLEQQLTGEDTLFDSKDSEGTDKAQTVRSASLWHYVKQNISDGSWPYYEEDGTALHGKESAVRSFTMDASSGVAGEIAFTEISMYWTRKAGDKLPGRLVIETSVTVKEQSCTITDTYELTVIGDDYEAWKWSHIDRK